MLQVDTWDADGKKKNQNRSKLLLLFKNVTVDGKSKQAAEV